MNPAPHFALVVGGGRGVGCALVRQLVRDPRVSCVFATWRSDASGRTLKTLADRSDGRLRLIQADTRRDEDLENLAYAIGEHTARLDLAIHAAGLLHDEDLKPEKSLAQVNRSSLARLFETNAASPVLVAKAIEGLVPRDAPFSYAVLTAMVGSISDNRLGGWYGYRASKAAANQLLRTLSIEWQRTRPKATVLAVHPGTTDTELSRPFQSRVPEGKLYSPDQSAARIIDVIRRNGPSASGTFRNWDGSEIPW